MFRWLPNIKTIMAAFVVVTINLGDMQFSLDKENESNAVINLQQNNNTQQVRIEMKGSSGSTVSSTGETVKAQGESSIQTDVSQQVIDHPKISDQIDTLDYLLSNNQHKGLTGANTGSSTDHANGHPLSQLITSNAMYMVKWDSTVYETFKWDNENIYLVEDHSVSGHNPSYQLIPGIWMRRNMKVGEKVTTMNNIIEWFDPDCALTERKNFPIEMTLEKHDATYDIGGDLGIQDIIVMKYDSSVGFNLGLYEKYYYSKEWGLVRWEEYAKRTDSLRNRRTFNKITNPIAPNISLSCI